MTGAVETVVSPDPEPVAMPVGRSRMRTLASDVLIYGLGDVVLRASSLLALPVYTRLFVPAEYGLLALGLSIAGMAATVVGLGGDSAYARYYFDGGTAEDKRSITSTWVIFLLVWSVGAILLTLPFVPLLASWSGMPRERGLVLTLALLGIPLTLLNSMLGQILRNEFRARLFTVLNVAGTLATLALSFAGAVLLHRGIAGVLAGGIVASLLFLPVRWWYVRSMIGLQFSMSWLRKMLAFGLPLVPASMAYWVFGTSDRLLLSRLSTLDQTGLYSVANSFTSLLALLQGAVGQAWSPHLVRAYTEDAEAARRLCGRVLTFLLLGFGILSVGLTAFSREAIMIAATPRYLGAAAAVGPLSLGYLAYASTQVTAVGISLTKRTSYFALFSWIAAGLNAGFNILFIPRWGMMAASWTTAGAYVFLTVAYAVTTQRLWPIRYEGRRVALIVALTLASVLALPAIESSRPQWAVWAKFLVCITYILTVLAIGGLRPADWRRLRSRGVLKEAVS